MQVLLFAATAAFLVLSPIVSAQQTTTTTVTAQRILQGHSTAIVKGSRKTISPAIDAVKNSGLREAQFVLQTWQAKNMWRRKSDGLFFLGEKIAKKTVLLTDFDTGEIVGEFNEGDLKRLKPNSGVRALIGTALVQFQLTDPDTALRRDALTAIRRDPAASHLSPLRASIPSETDPGIRARKQELQTLLTIRFDQNNTKRVTAINSIAREISLETRAALNSLLTNEITFNAPATANVGVAVTPGNVALSIDTAYELMVAAGAATPLPSPEERLEFLTTQINGGKVGGVPLIHLDTQDARDQAYAALNPKWSPDLTKASIVKNMPFHRVFSEDSNQVTDAAQRALKSIEVRVGLNRVLDLVLDGMSLASILFLAAIGLAITFGVMGVINMAHGEFIMMGAYTGYVVQQFVPNYTASILLALPLAFAVTFTAGVTMERLVIRHLYNRPLETLLATFGISIALQQIAKNIFGTQARPLTAPMWLDGAWVLNDVVSISYIRIAIFALALLFLGIFLFIMNRTRLGLETRAVTQNSRMAASMGINPGRVNMLTFGLGSGIAGIAGVAIGLFAKVTSELGSDYIVQSFMTVVVGGVGNIWGTLAGAAMIGFLQKGIEWMNPSNTLAAQTYMIIFIIIFIQFRPRGIIALKGRAAGD